VSVSIRPVRLGRPTFLEAARCTALDLLDADVAILGIPFTTPHDLSSSRSPSSDGPDAVRRQSERLAGTITGYDFDFGGPLFPSRHLSIADCGDVDGEPGQYEGNSRAATRVVQTIRAAGALPIVLGGDHAAVLPVLRAYSDLNDLCIVHMGAQLHWRDQVSGIRESLHSGMRRVSELPWIASMIQVGLRGPGAANQQEVEDARAFGSQVIRADEIHGRVDSVLRRVPHAKAYFACLDMDALDPAIAPGVELPAFGGLSYYDTSNFLRGVGPLVGLAVLGVTPARDLNDITSLLAARLILNVLGAVSRAQHSRPESAALLAQR
jgi:agmatinase